MTPRNELILCLVMLVVFLFFFGSYGFIGWLIAATMIVKKRKKVETKKKK